jgi:transposase, IS5 family
MIRYHPQQTQFVDFYLPFGGKLLADNRWVKLATMIPWQEVEECYINKLTGSGMGAPAKSGRIAFGALIIKERLGITDEETVAQISENPYLQYFLGLHEYQEKPLFDPSMMVHFRSRFSQEDHQLINSKIIDLASEDTILADARNPADKDSINDSPQDPPTDPSISIKNKGKLLLDASCTPADITYPTDLKLLNEAREKTEKYIDTLHAPFIGKIKKPRSYRQRARKDYLRVAKQRKSGKKAIRKVIGKQLRYVKRNLMQIDQLLKTGSSIELLSQYHQNCLETIRSLWIQQNEMHQEQKHRIADRIVSISQPHVRPIVRGKSGVPVEFGAKISISHFDGGYITLDRLSWDPYNETGDLVEQVESYIKRFGYYPESVHVDSIYRTRTNREYCKERDIRMSGPALGRRKKQTIENKDTLTEIKRQQREDEVSRIPVEGKFGNMKRKGTLARIMAKLAHTSESVIHVGIIVLNLDTWLRRIFLCLIRWWQKVLKKALRASETTDLQTFPTSAMLAA